MHAPLTTDRQRFYYLYSLVVEDFPTGIVDALVRSGHEAAPSKLLLVRNGRKIYLPWLIDMVELGMPHFLIPDDVRPSEVVTPLFQA